MLKSSTPTIIYLSSNPWPGHHGDTQGWGAPDLSDDQEWAPAPTYTWPWAPPFALNISAFAMNRQSDRGTLYMVEK